MRLVFGAPLRQCGAEEAEVVADGALDEVVGTGLVELGGDEAAREVLIDRYRCVSLLEYFADGVLQSLLVYGKDVVAKQFSHLRLDRVDELVGLLDDRGLRRPQVLGRSLPSSRSQDVFRL